jgi:DNA-binding MarR family transcriptional regulator
MRKTFGWQKRKDKISYSQLQEVSGLSKQSVADGIKGLIEKGYIQVEKSGQICSYAVVFETLKDTKPVKKVDQSENQTGQESRPEPVKKVDRLGEKPVKKVDTQKKEYKETIKEISCAGAQDVFSYYYTKYQTRYNSKPVCNVGRFIKQIKTMLESASLEELKKMVDYIWQDDFVVKCGHSPETVFTGVAMSKYRAMVIQDNPERIIQKNTCEYCGMVYNDFCRNPECPGLL